jgi:hypothetical protein
VIHRAKEAPRQSAEHDDQSRAERILAHLVDISDGRCTITDEQIEGEPDPIMCEVLAGLLVLHEDLVFCEERRQRSAADLQAAVRRIKALESIPPICMYCHNIRAHRASWAKLEDYVRERFDAGDSHAVCPDCYTKRFPDDL